MEFAVPQRVKTFTALALVGYGSLTFQRIDDYEFTIPLKPAFSADLAYTGGTAVLKGEGGHHPRPPEARIDPVVRRITGGAITPDS